MVQSGPQMDPLGVLDPLLHEGFFALLIPVGAVQGRGVHPEMSWAVSAPLVQLSCRLPAYPLRTATQFTKPCAPCAICEVGFTALVTPPSVTARAYRLRMCIC